MKKFIKFALVVCSILFMSGCVTVDDSKHEIIDCSGAKVEISKDVNKVISVNQSFCAFLTAMDMPEKIVGTHGSVLSHAWLNTFAPEISSAERFGYKPAAEKIYSEDIDLVVLNDPAYAESLREVGIPAIYFGYDNLEELFYAVDLIGDIFGKDAKEYVTKWKQLVNDTIKDIKEDVSSLTDEEKKNVYYINAASNPSDVYSTYGGDSFYEYWITTIGGNFVTKEFKDITNLEQEVALSLNPDTIIISGYAEYSRKEELLSNPLWKDIEAVKTGSIYLMPTSMVSYERFSVEFPMLLRYSCNALYPSLHSFDAINDLRSFYEEYYNISLTDEQLTYLCKGLGPDGSIMG